VAPARIRDSAVGGNWRRQANAFDQSQRFFFFFVKLVMAKFKQFAMPLKYSQNTLYDDGFDHNVDGMFIEDKCTIIWLCCQDG
jgi:hypothetical protein